MWKSSCLCPPAWPLVSACKPFKCSAPASRILLGISNAFFIASSCKLRRFWRFKQLLQRTWVWPTDLEVWWLDFIHVHHLHLHSCAGRYVGHGQVAEEACGRPAQTSRDVWKDLVYDLRVLNDCKLFNKSKMLHFNTYSMMGISCILCVVDHFHLKITEWKFHIWYKLVNACFALSVESHAPWSVASSWASNLFL